MSKKKIRVAVAGVGSCASALIQGVQWYKNNPDEIIGLSQIDIGGYSVTDITFVVGFDIDSRKVGRYLDSAIYSQPNSNMRAVVNVSDVVNPSAIVHRGPTLDGVADHMRNYPKSVTFDEDTVKSPITAKEYRDILEYEKVDVLLNYMPVGSEEASQFYIENAILSGIHVINCMPSYISTDAARGLEQLAIDHNVTLVLSDMRSAWGASRISEILQGSMLDAGLLVTQHIQTNMSCGSTQGHETIRTGRTAGTDFLNMADKTRLKSKHISKENVLTGQNIVRNVSDAGMTMFAGPSLTLEQRPGGNYLGSDNKVANFDIVAYGWAGARYEFTARLSVQDSPNSGAIVADAIRYCKVASELGIVGALRGASSYTQKSPPLQMKTEDAKFECDALARRIVTPLMAKQLKENGPHVDNLDYTFQDTKTAYE